MLDLPTAETNTVPNMASLPRVTRQQPEGRLTTLDHFFYGEDNALSFLEQILILVMDLPFLHVMPLPKAPLVDLQNALSTTMVFYTALPLTNNLNSYPPKCDSVPTITYHLIHHPEATG